MEASKEGLMEGSIEGPMEGSIEGLMEVSMKGSMDLRLKDNKVHALGPATDPIDCLPVAPPRKTFCCPSHAACPNINVALYMTVCTARLRSVLN